MISLTPLIFSKSPRTEVAQPPHVMFGTFSFTKTRLLALVGFSADVAATAGGLFGLVCELFFESCFAGAAPWSQPDSPIKPETSNPNRIAFVFIGSFSRNINQLRLGSTLGRAHACDCRDGRKGEFRASRWWSSPHFGEDFNTFHIIGIKSVSINASATVAAQVRPVFHF